MYYHPARIAQWLNAKTPDEKLAVYPLYVEISPVGQCNQRCIFCAVDYIGYVNRRIDTSTLCLALDDMAKQGVKSVMFAGEGEPMLHPDMARITEHAGQAGLDVAFTTNGTAMTEKFVTRALPWCKWIKVSMNGGEKTYGKIHQTKQEVYERVWKNIEFGIRRRLEISAPCAIGIQCVVLPDNIEDLDGLCRRASQTGLDYIVLKPYSQHKSSKTTTYQDINYHTQAIKEAIDKAEALSTSTFKVIARRAAMEDWDAQAHSYHTCHATPYFWAYVMSSGDVYSCSAYLLNPEFNMGNINERNFTDIWVGEKRKAHLVAMESLDISKCRLNCRMNQVNKYLEDIKHPSPHASFI